MGEILIMTLEQLAKLPKWAQEEFKDLERERFVAVRALNEYCDSQTPSPIFTEEYECTGEGKGPTPKRRYFHGRRVSVEWRGVLVEVSCNEPRSQSGAGITIQWGDPGKLCQHIAAIPESFQRIRLVSKEDMR